MFCKALPYFFSQGTDLLFEDHKTCIVTFVILQLFLCSFVVDLPATSV